jgi:hypothetical protein
LPGGKSLLLALDRLSQACALELCYNLTNRVQCDADINIGPAWERNIGALPGRSVEFMFQFLNNQNQTERMKESVQRKKKRLRRAAKK